MGGGQQQAARDAKAWEACEEAEGALEELFGNTDAYDRAFGAHPQIVDSLNEALKKYGLKIVKEAGK